MIDFVKILPSNKEQLFEDLLKALVLMLDLKGGEQVLHSWRVAAISYNIAKTMGLQNATSLYYAGLLHDIGGMSLPTHILHYVTFSKVDPIVLNHSILGVELLKTFKPFKPILNTILYHHEHYDGTGFPHKLKGNQIPIESSIILTADLLDIYFKEKPLENLNSVIDLLDSFAGTKVYPEVANATKDLFIVNKNFLSNIFDDEKLKKYIQNIKVQPLATFDSYEDIITQILWLFARVVDSQHDYTMGHSVRTAYLSLRIAENYAPEMISKWDILISSLLHDIGEIAIPDYILRKEGQLSSIEWDVVKQHTNRTIDIISTISDLKHLAYPAASNHEWFNGSGYPYGTVGENIPLIGRIIAIADAFDAMLSNRPYREKLTLEETLKNIEILKGEQFDPDIVDASWEVLKDYYDKQLNISNDIRDFYNFFKKDIVDIKLLLKSAGIHSNQKVFSPSRGVVLLDLEQWKTATTDFSFNIISGKNNIRSLTGYISDNFLYQLMRESSDFISAYSKRLKNNESFTKYVFSLTGTPIELIVIKEDKFFKLLFRSAKNKLSSLEKLSHFYKNFMSSVESVVFTDLQGKIIDVNRRFLDFYGYQIKDVIGKPISIISSDKVSRDIYKNMWEQIKNPEIATWEGEIVNKNSNGKEVYVYLTINAIKDANGKIIGYIGNTIDISARKKAEAELEKNKKQLEEQNKKLKKLNELKTDMVAITSHDLKSPINTILTITGFIKENFNEFSKEQLKYYIEQIEKKGKSSIKFITDMLNLAKMESGTLDFKPTLFELNEFIEDIYENFKYLAKEKNINFKISTYQKKILIYADKEKLKQVFENLISNSIKFVDVGGEVNIEINIKNENTVAVYVTDNGEGIPDEDLKGIFEKYKQVKKSKKHGFGSGLGLYIAKMIIDSHKGNIYAENIKPHGAKFTVEIPISFEETNLKGILKNKKIVILFDVNIFQKEVMSFTLEKYDLQWVAINKFSSLLFLLKNQASKKLFVPYKTKNLKDILKYITEKQPQNTELFVFFEEDDTFDNLKDLSAIKYEKLYCPLLPNELDVFFND